MDMWQPGCFLVVLSCCVQFFCFIDTSQIPTRPFYDILTWLLSRSLLARCISPMFFCEPTGCNDKTWKKSEVTWTSKGVKPIYWSSRCKGWWTHCVFLQIFMQLGIQAAKPPCGHPKKRCILRFFASKEACSKISASEMVSLKKASLRRNPAEIHQCLRVFESVRMQFRWWHVSCSWKACIAKCNRGTGTLAVSCNFCGGAVSSSGALAYFKELVK